MADAERNKAKLLVRSREAAHKLGALGVDRYKNGTIQKFVDDLGRTYSPDKQRMSDEIVRSVNALLRHLTDHGIDPTQPPLNPEAARKALIESVGIDKVPIGLIPEEFKDEVIDCETMATRPFNALRNCDVTTYGQLGDQSISTLMTMPGIHIKSVDEIKEFLACQGFLIPELLPPEDLSPGEHSLFLDP